MRKKFQAGAQILPCPEYQKMKIRMRIRALEERNTTFDLTPHPTILKNTDISQKIELLVPFLYCAFKRTFIFTWEHSDLLFA